MKEISVCELKQMTEKSEEFLLIDVREKEEYETEHIRGSIFLPLSQFEPDQIPINDEKSIIFYCRSGFRSAEALKKFLQSSKEQINFSVYNLKGGILAWKQLGYPTIQE